MATFHLHIEGRVQGVGFRPHVYRLARSYELTGWISNGLDGVHIRISGEPSVVSAFQRELIRHPPERAIITHCLLREEIEEYFEGFQIIESSKAGKAKLLLTPDLGICEDCRRDLWDKDNRRFHYAFTTCTHCGPRYSIISALPYDREYTTMDEFCMCGNCHMEYHHPEDRRYFSQTNSCPACPVHLLWMDKYGSLITQHPEKAIRYAIDALNRGEILGVKGIGGFLLVADATQVEVVEKLRERKRRPKKPFALLYPDKKILEGDVWIREEQYQCLTSIESPIVLFRLREKPASGIAFAQIAPGLDSVGVMQPYTPLLELLCRPFGKPLIATSGNYSGSPIFFEDKAGLTNLSPVVDFFLTNDRNIVAPQDDSVIRFGEQGAKPVFLRRSRGYAPSLLHPAFDGKTDTVLAMGAMLKSTFAVYTQGNTYVSQYLGNTDNFDVQESYRHTLDHFIKLFELRPDTVAVDLHPDYFTTQWGEDLAEEWGIPLKRVQHHRAHFAAVLAEHHLLETKDPVLGVIWDGTGYGDDGQIWGGEFFRFAQGEMKRVAHLRYFDHLYGDKMAREPRLTALSLAGELEYAEGILKPKFSDQERQIYFRKRLGNSLQTSSMGRLFDGVSSLLGLCDRMTFEGESAMYLEVAANEYIRKNGYPECWYSTGATPDWLPVICGVLEDIHWGASAGFIAAKFHRSLVEMIRSVAKSENVQKLAFSGGVWQNALLLDLVVAHLGKEYELYFHEQLSPNDECISFGQLAWLLR